MSSRPAAQSIPERLLRNLWIRQSFPASGLKTEDGRPLKIILPGRLNRNSGPDFIGARIRIGDVVYGGDVELHRHSEDWRRHGHQRDPRYNSVILHVVFNGKAGHAPPLTSSARPIPVLLLGDFFNALSPGDLKMTGPGKRFEKLAPIRCHRLNDAVKGALLRTWLEKLSSERIELKIRRFEERLKEMSYEQSLRIREPHPSYDDLPFGLNPDELPPPARDGCARAFSRLADWEQLTYEGIMEALGYENNRDPFLTLARNLSLRIIARHFTPPPSCDPTPRLEAALFRIAGLLDTAEAPADKDVRRHVKMLRNLWKLSGNCYAGEYISYAGWKFFRMRPENFPTLRLAGAARLLPRLIRKTFFKHIIQIVRGDVLAVRQKYLVLEGLFTVPADGIWTSHYRFGERANKPIKTLIGKGRAAEIIVNGVIPICLLYARIFGDTVLREGALVLFEECPPAIDNSATSLITDQLIKGRLSLDSALLQQGALQLHNFYCMEERCSECAVGKLVFNAPTGALLPSQAGRSTS